MKYNILLVYGLLMVLLTGCYKDEGSYKYHDENKLTLEWTEKGVGLDSNSFVTNQPVVDTAWYVVTPKISQTLNSDESQLAFRWLVTYGIGNETVTDTLYTKECRLKLPPKIKSRYTLLLCVTDLSTGIEFYRPATVTTQIPFVNSWLVLNGAPGQRKISAIELISGEYKITEDFYEIQTGQKRFQDVSSMVYILRGGGLGGERLMLFEPDSAFCMYPFEAQITSMNMQMFPRVPQLPQIKFGMSCEVDEFSGVVDSEGKFYHNRKFGYYYLAQTTPECNNYRVDKAFLSYNGEATLWDVQQHRFMYYSIIANWYGWDDIPQDESNMISRVTMVPENVISAQELAGLEVIWIGRGMKTFADAGASVVAKDAEGYRLLHFAYGEDKEDKSLRGKDEDEEEYSYVRMQGERLTDAPFLDNSLFAVTCAFNDQLFFTVDNVLYVYNTVNGAASSLYTLPSGCSITKIAFSMSNEDSMNPGIERILGMAVLTPDGKGELHELSFESSGDLGEVNVHKGLGPIVDFVYTATQRIIN